MKSPLTIAIVLYTGSLAACAPAYGAWTGLDEVSTNKNYYASICPPGSSNVVIHDYGVNTYVHVVYEAGQNGSTAYAVFHRMGILDRGTGAVAWGDPEMVSACDGGEIRGWPGVAIDGEHNLHVVWETTEHRSPSSTNGMYDNFEVYYRRGLWNEVFQAYDWCMPARVSDGPLYSGQADVACDEYGGSHIVFADARRDKDEWQAYNDIYYDFFARDNAHDPDPPTRLTTDGAVWICRDPDVAVWTEWVQDPFGGGWIAKPHVYVAWTDERDYREFTHSSRGYIYFTEYDPFTYTWSPELELRTASSRPGTGDAEWNPSILLLPGPEALGEPTLEIYWRWSRPANPPNDNKFYCYRREPGGVWEYQDQSGCGFSDYFTIKHFDALADADGGVHLVYRNKLGHPDTWSTKYAYRPPAQGRDWTNFETVIQHGYEGDPPEIILDYDMVSLAADDDGWIHAVINKTDGRLETFRYPKAGVFYFNDLGTHGFVPDSVKPTSASAPPEPDAATPAPRDVGRYTPPDLGFRPSPDTGKYLAPDVGASPGGGELGAPGADAPPPEGPALTSPGGFGGDMLSGEGTSSGLPLAPAAASEPLSCGPNPVTASARITFKLEAPCAVKLAVYDLSGRRIATLADGRFDAGEHAVEWRADVPTGVYIYRLDAAGKVASRKLVVAK